MSRRLGIRRRWASRPVGQSAGLPVRNQHLKHVPVRHDKLALSSSTVNGGRSGEPTIIALMEMKPTASFVPFLIIHFTPSTISSVFCLR